MRKILILTAGFGNGHNAAAFNLRDGFRKIAPHEVQVEVLDPIKLAYGLRGEIVKSCFLAIVNNLPGLWERAYRVSDRSPAATRFIRRLRRMRETLERLIWEQQPDAVISTCPIYNIVFDRIYATRPCPFQRVTVVTDSISVNSLWYSSPADYYFVPNNLSEEAISAAGVPASRIIAAGFPVAPWFYELAQTQLTPRAPEQERKRLLYLTHQGRCTSGRVIETLAAEPDIEMTIVCGSQPALERELRRRTAHVADRVRVLGWTGRMPELLMTSHLVITKAGGAIVQEALAARCPIIINRVIPGHEEGNAKLVEMLGIGAIATSDEEIVAVVRRAFEQDSRQWYAWKSAMAEHSRPDAALRIAETVLRNLPVQHPKESRPRITSGGPLPATIRWRRTAYFRTRTTSH